MPNFGKYRGKVVDPVDPLQLGSILALVPAVSELPVSWALPAAPYAGPGVGFFAVPPVGANVWIEFEGGDPNYPIWSGCFWGEGEALAVQREGVTYAVRWEEEPGSAGKRESARLVAMLVEAFAAHGLVQGCRARSICRPARGRRDRAAHRRQGHSLGLCQIWYIIGHERIGQAARLAARRRYVQATLESLRHGLDGVR